MKQGLSRRTLFSMAGMAAALGVQVPLFGKSLSKAFNASPTPFMFETSVLPKFGRIVDMHVHYRHDESGFLDTLLKLSDRLNITACMLTPFEHRKVVADAAKKYPKQIIPFGALKLDAPDATRQMAEFHDLGYRGLGEISSMQKNCSDPKYFPIFELSSQYKWILMFHTGIVGRDDFNKAENPPCVFTDFATCPLPPPQNRLPLAVTAGEQMYGKRH